MLIISIYWLELEGRNGSTGRQAGRKEGSGGPYALTWLHSWPGNEQLDDTTHTGRRATPLSTPDVVTLVPCKYKKKQKSAKIRNIIGKSYTFDWGFNQILAWFIVLGKKSSVCLLLHFYKWLESPITGSLGGQS